MNIGSVPALVVAGAVVLIIMVLALRGHIRRRPSPLTDGLVGHLYAARLRLWRAFLRWPRPLAYKLLVLLCLAGALAEGVLILFVVPPPYAVTAGGPVTAPAAPLALPTSTTPAAAPPTSAAVLPTATETSGPTGASAPLSATATTTPSPPSATATVLVLTTPSPTVTPLTVGTPAPVAWTPALQAAHFVTEPDEGVTPFLTFIRAAHTELDGEIYLLSDPAVLAALSDAAARGVRVRIILEKNPFGGNGSSQAAYRDLTAHGVQVAWGGSPFRYMHAKMLIADGQQSWVGTMNWTLPSFSRNRDFAAIVDDPAVVRSTVALFDADWTGQTVTTLAPGLVVSPLNARTAITDLIAGAGYTLDVYAEVLTDPQVVQALAAAERRGVRVRVVYNAGGDLTPLTAAGVQARRVTYPHSIHAKAIVADGNRMFLGSENLTPTSLDQNREVGLLLRDRLAISLVEQPFAEDFTRGHASLPPVAAPTPHPLATPLPGFVVQAWVTPQTMRYDAYPILSARSLPGETCSASVIYSTGYPPVSFFGRRQTAGADGIVRWGWHEMTKGDSGDATVSCTYHGAVQNGYTRFSVTR